MAPYLCLLPEDAGQRSHSLREVFNGLRYVIKTGAQWRMMPHDLPPWAAVHQQAQPWLAWGCFDRLRRSGDKWVFTSRSFQYLWLDTSPFAGNGFPLFADKAAA